ncbi:MAG: hypothetical protein WCR67_07865 [Bacilli bacterium]
MTTFRKILLPFESLIYIIVFILAILACNGIGIQSSAWDVAQTRIIAVGSVTAAVGVWGTVVLQHSFKIKISGLVDILIGFDLFASIICGECFLVYRTMANYDKFLHAFGTAQLAIAGFAIAAFFLEGKNLKYQVVYSLVFAFFFAIAMEAIWELYEYTVDSLCGTDMQKYIPDQFVGCIDSLTGEVTCSDEQILEFYKTQAGMHYGVTDTMGDVIADILGAVGGMALCALVFKFKPELQSGLIHKKDGTSSTDTLEIPVVKSKDEYSFIDDNNHHNNNENA